VASRPWNASARTHSANTEPPTQLTTRFALAAGGLYHGIAEVAGACAYADIHPCRFQPLELVGRARGADHFRAQCFRGLQRRDPDARGNAGHQQPFAGGEPALGDEHVVHHHEGERDACRLLPRQVCGDSDGLPRIHQRVFGVRSAATPHDALPRRESGDAGTGLGNLARAFDAGRLRCACLGQPATGDELAAVEPGCAHAHQHLPWRGLR